MSVLEPGRNRVAFALFDRSRRQIADTPTAQYRYLAPTNSLTVETLRGSTLSSFKVPNQILDRSIFDYRFSDSHSARPRSC